MLYSYVNVKKVSNTDRLNAEVSNFIDNAIKEGSIEKQCCWLNFDPVCGNRPTFNSKQKTKECRTTLDSIVKKK